LLSHNLRTRFKVPLSNNSDSEDENAIRSNSAIQTVPKQTESGRAWHLTDELLNISPLSPLPATFSSQNFEADIDETELPSGNAISDFLAF
jgi:hypothetical protein